MKVARLHGPGDIRVHEEDDPVPAAGEQLIRVTAVGLCGSDRHWFLDGGIGDARLGRPLILGHEISGVIESGPRRGTRVALDPADPCRQCDLCRSDRANLCQRMRFAGHGTTDGGLRGLMAWPERLLTPIPDGIGDAEATLLEPLGIVLYALDLGEFRSGMSAGVYGCGPIGLLLVGALRALGAGAIVATDRLAHRVAAARAMGATEAVVVGGPSGEPAAATLLPTSAVDVAFEVAGDDGAVEAAIDGVRHAGRVVLIGIPADDRTSFRASTARRKGLELVLCRRMRESDLPRAVRLVEEGRLELAQLVSATVGIDGVGAAFKRLAEQSGLKVVVRP